ncbi:MAG: SPOR domain-containing protein [Clostridium sp.]|nr:SPOR domain-containing protein [Clostridium sp.]
MSYTRYDYRKKGKKNFIIYSLVIIFSIIIGTIIFKFLILGRTELIKNNKIGNNFNNSDTQEKISFGIIQCGLFSNEENANEVLNKISSDFQKVLVKSDDKYKVIAGIYSKENINEKLSLLSNQQIENFNINCVLNNNDSNEKIISKIIEAYLKVIDTVNEKDVEGYNTKKFKQWVFEASSNCKEEENLNKLLENISSLPEEYKKENISDSINFLYNFLMKYKS